MTLILSFTALFAADSYTDISEWSSQQDKVRIITQDEIDSLEGITVVQMIEKFGEPIRLETNALIWAKYREDMDFNQSKVTTKVAYAYWFIFDDKRYPKPTSKLKYIVSLKGPISEPKKAIFEYIPEMTVDWPKSLKGKSVRSIANEQ